MKKKMLNPGVVRAVHGRRQLFAKHAPPRVILQKLPAPIAVIKRRIGKHEISLQILVCVIQKRAFVVPAHVAAVNPANRQIHLRQTPSRLVALLPENRDAVSRV